MCVTQKGLLAAARRGDLATCPSCRSSSGMISNMRCTRTFINNRLASVCGDGITCGALTLGASGNVFAENRPMHRLTNTNTCGGATITASPNTFTGS